MNRATQNRTVLAILMLVGIGLINTAFAAIWKWYGEPWAWTVYGTGVATFVIALIRQPQLSTLQTFGLLAIAYVAAVAGVLLGL